MPNQGHSWRYHIDVLQFMDRAAGEDAIAADWREHILPEVYRMLAEGGETAWRPSLHACREALKRYRAGLIPGGGPPRPALAEGVFPDKKETYIDAWEVLELGAKQAEALHSSDPSQLVATIDASAMFPDGKPFALVATGDWHVDSPYCHHRELARKLRLVLDHDRLLLGILGDQWDNFMPTKIKANAAITPDLARRAVRDLLLQLSRKIVFVVLGNHDLFSNASGGGDATDDVSFLACPVLREGGRLLLKTMGCEYVLGVKHRYRFNSSFNPNHSTRRMLDEDEIAGDFDAGFIGHHHILDVEDGHKRGRQRVFIRTGTFKVNDPWSLQHGYNPGQVGMPAVVFWQQEKRMVPFRHVEDAVAYMAAVC